MYFNLNEKFFNKKQSKNTKLKFSFVKVNNKFCENFP